MTQALLGSINREQGVKMLERRIFSLIGRQPGAGFSMTKIIGYIANKPRLSDRRAADHHGVGAGLGEHCLRIGNA